MSVMSVMSKPSAKTKLWVAVGVIAVCFVWIVFQIPSLFPSSPAGKAPSGPAYDFAKKVNDKLNVPGLRSVSVSVVSTNPEKYSVTGIILPPGTKAQLDKVIEEEMKGKDFTTDVMVSK